MQAINVDSIKQWVLDNQNNTPMYAKVIQASRCIDTGAKIFTFELFFPRFILAEQNTHRIFSRNTGSSRAIPLLRMLKELRGTPVVPMFWGANKAGMQSAQELPFWKAKLCHLAWYMHRIYTFGTVRFLSSMGLHKQWANRLLEPHTYIRQVVTSTDWENYLNLRFHDDAQPEIVALAFMIKRELDKYNSKQAIFNEVSNKNSKLTKNWHLPYITQVERKQYAQEPVFLAKLSAARCARTSYLTQEGIEPNQTKELSTFSKLAESKPIHASPLEHQGYPLQKNDLYSRNFKGFKQFRAIFEEAN